MRLGDLDALKKEFAKITYTRFTADMGQGGFEMFSEKEIEDIIDNAPTVDIKDQIAGAYNEGYSCGSRENTRPQGEWIEDNGDSRCPFCKVLRDSIHGSFCPNCGAKLKVSTN